RKERGRAARPKAQCAPRPRSLLARCAAALNPAPAPRAQNTERPLPGPAKLRAARRYLARGYRDKKPGNPTAATLRATGNRRASRLAQEKACYGAKTIFRSSSAAA